ncbi:MAG: NDP-sugar synthase [Armatimonadota bacterium]|nr:NDP-sugar synthase [Armatimonadota bacterium]MDW8026227.1 NDP-sugar synthase [Armatimonadota bacterium]
MPVQTAIVLAAGLGKKMFPYCDTRQKCAIPIANKPAIRRLVEQLASSDIKHIAVVVGYLENQVRHALFDFDGAQITFIRQSEQAGTAHALLCAIDELGKEQVGERFLVVYGDLVMADGWAQEVIRHHEETQPIASAFVQPIGQFDPREWICASVHDGKLTSVLGHPRGGVTHKLIGAFVFHEKAISYMRANPGVMTSIQVGMMPPMEAELAQSLQMMIERGEEVQAIEVRRFAVDLDKPWHMIEATVHVIREMASKLERSVISPSAKVSDGAEIMGNIVVGDDCVIGRGVVIQGHAWIGSGTSITTGAILRGHNIIGRNCKVRDYCLLGSNSVLGDNCIIGHAAEFDGLAFDGAYFYHYCEVAGVVGSSVDIGAATVCGTLRFDDLEKVHTVRSRKEIPHIGANATYIGDYCRTGVNAIIMPGCKIGCYSIVGPGVVLYEDLPPRTLVLVKQELVRKEWGPERYGW